jgi:hypothetical protein
MVKQRQHKRMIKGLALLVMTTAAVIPLPVAQATPQAQSALPARLIQSEARPEVSTGMAAEVPGGSPVEVPIGSALLHQARLLAAGTWAELTDGAADLATLAEPARWAAQSAGATTALSDEQMIERVLGYYPQPDANHRARIAEALSADPQRSSDLAQAACRP